MEKDALLKIIIQDIKELDILLNTFTGKPDISKTFINLSKSKAKGIVDELDMLAELAETSNQKTTTIIKEDVQQTYVVKPEPITIVKTETEKPIITPTNDQKKEEISEAPVYANKRTTAKEQKEQIEIKPVDTEIPEVKHHEKKTETLKEVQHATLGETLRRDSTSFNEVLARKNENDTPQRYQTKPIDDLKKNIGINDRFYFQRELFDGNIDLMNQTIEQLNHMQNLESAESFLTANFSWENNNDAVKAFKDLIRRRYI